MSEDLGGAAIYLKREDLAHTGAHKINNVLGQCLLARHMGKPRVIAETGAGQHGVATATACALLGLECVVYMGAEDVERQALNVFRMELLGATVCPVTSGSQTLKDAINEAMRDWVTNVRTTYYCIGSVMGPHPYPTHRARLPARHRPRGARADPGERGAPAGRAGRLRRRRLERDRALPPLPRGRRRADDRRRGGRRRARVGAARRDAVRRRARACCTACGACCSPTTTARSSRPTRSRPGSTIPGVGPEHAYLRDAGRAEYVARDRRRGARRLRLPVADGGHHSGARVGPRGRARPQAGADACRGRRSCSSTSRAAATRTLPQVRDMLAAPRRSRTDGPPRRALRGAARARRAGAHPVRHGGRSGPRRPPRRWCSRWPRRAPTSSRSACRSRIRWPRGRRSSARASGRCARGRRCGASSRSCERLRPQIDVPLVLMGYANPFLRDGRAELRRGGPSRSASTASSSSICRRRKASVFYAGLEGCRHRPDPAGGSHDDARARSRCSPRRPAASSTTCRSRA